MLIVTLLVEIALENVHQAITLTQLAQQLFLPAKSVRLIIETGNAPERSHKGESYLFVRLYGLIDLHRC